MTDEQKAYELKIAWMGNAEDKCRDWMAVLEKARELLTPKPPITAVPEGMRVEPLTDADGNPVPYSPDHDGPFCTRDGRFVRILATDISDDDYPISASYSLDDGGRLVDCFASDGKLLSDGSSDLDIMCARFVPIKREPREFWLNVYGKSSDEFVHPTKEIADARSSHHRTECIHLREVMEGE